MVMAERHANRIVRLLDTEDPMPACEQEVMVGPYHDGELSPGAREAFEAHLAACPACAAELSRVRNVSRWMEPLRASALTPDETGELARSAMAAIAQADAEADAEQSARMSLKPGRAVRWVKWVTAVAAAVFLFSLVQLFRAQWNPPGTPDGGPSAKPAWTGEQENATHHGRPATSPRTIPGQPGPETRPPAPEPGGNRPPAQPDEGV